MEKILNIKRQLENFIETEKQLTGKKGHFSLRSKEYSSAFKFHTEISGLKNQPQLLDKKNYIKSNDKFFINACPHRGSKLKHDPSNQSIVCPYHGWSFDPDGLLEASTGFHCPYKKGSLKLKEVPARDLGGMAFLDPDGLLKGDLIDEINLFSRGTEALAERVNIVKCNWKFLVESLLETYHFPFAHGVFLKHFDNAFFSLQTSEGMNARIVVPMDNFLKCNNSEDLEGVNIMYYVFPFTFVLFIGSGHVFFKIRPLDSGTSEFTATLFGSDNVRAGDSFKLMEQILDQDFAILESQQENVVFDQVYHLSPYETLIRKFHENLANPMDQYSSVESHFQSTPTGPYLS